MVSSGTETRSDMQVIMRGFPDEVEEDASAAASSQQPQTKPTEILTAAEQMPKLEAGTVA